jgi:hypothetical protein
LMRVKLWRPTEANAALLGALAALASPGTDQLPRNSFTARSATSRRNGSIGQPRAGLAQ